MRRVSITRSQLTGGLPQASLVPPPRGTAVMPSAAAARSTAAASPVSAGLATNRGATPDTASAGPASRTSEQALASASGAGSPVMTGRPRGVPLRVSKLLQRPGGHQRMRRAADAGNLATQPRRREDLARVAQACRVERAAQQLHGVQVAGAEHLRHELGLVDAHAVLAGDRPAV